MIGVTEAGEAHASLHSLTRWKSRACRRVVAKSRPCRTPTGLCTILVGVLYCFGVCDNASHLSAR